MNIKHADIRFQPWVGENYGKGGIFGVPVLTVGESNYGGSSGRKKDAEFTREMIQCTIEARRHRFFSGVQQCFVKDAASIESRREFWSSVAHIEFIQDWMSGPGIRPTESMYERDRLVFEAIVRQLKPKCILFACKRLYWQIESNYQERESAKKRQYDSFQINGALATCVSHPARYGFQKSRPIVKWMLKSVGGKCHI